MTETDPALKNNSGTGDEAAEAAPAVSAASVCAPAAPAEPAVAARGGGAPAPGDSPEDENPAAKKIALPLRIFGVVLIVLGVLEGLGMIFVLILMSVFFADVLDMGVVSYIMTFAGFVLEFVSATIFLRLGIGLLRNNRRHAAGLARTQQFLLIAILLLDIMTQGISVGMLYSIAAIVIMVALQSYLDPSLAEERELTRKLRKMEQRTREEKRLERQRKFRGKAPYQLNYFNIFWTFVVCSVLGLVVELAYHMIVVDPGVYQDRAGMLFGPFSPIYGFGAVLMTLGLNGIRDKNPILIFLLSAVIGGAFEYFVSWFMQFSFGITAWDYTGTFLSIDGRTNGFYMACWGVLGVVWVKFLLPGVFKLIHLIPWDWRYAVTGVATALMIVDGVMTLQSLDCWYERSSGQAVETSVQIFYAEHFDDEYMANRFQSMTMNVEDSTQVDPVSMDAEAEADAEAETVAA